MRKYLFAVLAVLLTGVAVFAQGAPTYFYVVTAQDVNGLQSPNSNQISATLPAQLNSTLCVTTPGACTVGLTWTAPTIPANGAAIAGYNVFRGSVSGGPYTKINTALVTTTSYADPFTYPNAPSGGAATVK